MSFAQQGPVLDGTWVFRVNGQNILKLTLSTKNGVASGSLSKPERLKIDQDGDVTGIGPRQVTVPVEISRVTPSRLELTIDGDRFVMTLRDQDHATLVLEGMRPWNLDRATGDVKLATRLREPHYPPNIRSLREKLQAMVNQEQQARLAFDTERMEAADTKNRPEVLRMFEQYGWITISLAGKDAAHNFWVLVQHQTPEIQRRFLPALEKAAKAGNASMSDYAYLYDRVQMGLDKPQHWGTQTRCEDGKPVLYTVDDPAGLEARRKELFLQSIEDYLKTDYLTKFCASIAH